MRVATVVLSLLVALLVTAAALIYIPAYVGQSRIYPETGSRHTGPQARAYHSYGYEPQADTRRLAEVAGADPNHQRYYSESEGWTYYTLPASGESQ